MHPTLTTPTLPFHLSFQPEAAGPCQPRTTKMPWWMSLPLTWHPLLAIRVLRKAFPILSRVPILVPLISNFVHGYDIITSLLSSRRPCYPSAYPLDSDFLPSTRIDVSDPVHLANSIPISGLVNMVGLVSFQPEAAAAAAAHAPPPLHPKFWPPPRAIHPEAKPTYTDHLVQHLTTRFSSLSFAIPLF